MRTARVCFLMNIVALVLFCLPMSAGQKHTAIMKSAPKLRTIIMYEWALSAGGTKVNLDSKRLESFVRHVRMSEEEADAVRTKVGSGYPIFSIRANLKNQDIAAMRKFIDGSYLRDFRPQVSDIKDRQPNVDECPPTLVIIWTDKRRVFQLPLHVTIKKNLPKDRQQAYQNMEKVCDSLWRLNDSYAKKPYLSAVSVKGKEYKAFEEERERLIR